MEDLESTSGTSTGIRINTVNPAGGDGHGFYATDIRADGNTQVAFGAKIENVAGTTGASAIGV